MLVSSNSFSSKSITLRGSDLTLMRGLCFPITPRSTHHRKVVAWWYTCRKLIWWSLRFRIMMKVSTNSHTCKQFPRLNLCLAFRPCTIPSPQSKHTWESDKIPRMRTSVGVVRFDVPILVCYISLPPGTPHLEGEGVHGHKRCYLYTENRDCRCAVDRWGTFVAAKVAC